MLVEGLLLLEDLALDVCVCDVGLLVPNAQADVSVLLSLTLKACHCAWDVLANQVVQVEQLAVQVLEIPRRQDTDVSPIFSVGLHVVVLNQVYARKQIELRRRETFLVDDWLSCFKEVCEVRLETVFVQTDPTGFGDCLVYVEPICESYLGVILVGKQADCVANLVHLLLTSACNSVHVLKIHEHEQEQVVVVLNLLVQVVCGGLDVCV